MTITGIRAPQSRPLLLLRPLGHLHLPRQRRGPRPPVAAGLLIPWPLLLLRRRHRRRFARHLARPRASRRAHPHRSVPLPRRRRSRRLLHLVPRVPLPPLGGSLAPSIGRGSPRLYRVE